MFFRRGNSSVHYCIRSRVFARIRSFFEALSALPAEGHARQCYI